MYELRFTFEMKRRTKNPFNRSLYPLYNEGIGTQQN